MKSSSKWLQRIFRWEVAGVVIAAVSLIYAYKSFKIDEGGELQITTHFTTSENDGDIAVVTDAKDLASTLNQLLPEFRNSIKYSLKNFNLTYDISTSEPVDFTFSPDFSMRQVSPTRVSATLADHTLYAHSQVEAPFVTAVPSQSHFNITITIRATFDGASEPYASTCHYCFYPTSALNTLKERHNRYACVFEAHNGHITELITSANSSETADKPSDTKNQETVASGQTTVPLAENNKVTSSKATIESKDKFTESIWSKNILGIPVSGLIIGIILCIIYIPALTAPDDIVDDIFIWPWQFKNVRKKVRNRLYGWGIYSFRQKFWSDVVIFSTLLSIGLTIICFIGGSIYLIYLGYTTITDYLNPGK